MFDTITAISTGNINQPISIIRVSGPEAFNIISKIFTGKIGNHQTVTYGYIKSNEETLDEVLISWFKAPNTFTGEDVVEINAHGGVVNSNNILQLILANGARLAEPGEFSRRAFLNGKMDLVKSEAIHDLIFAKTKAQTQLSVKKFDGKTSSLIDALQEKIMFVIATIETNIDYPEYDDVEQMTSEVLVPKLQDILNDLNEIIDSSNASKYIYSGVNVAIVGKPNVGKSSLLNSFLQENKAIVTNIPGTTRDVVEGSMQINQVLLNFKDTAGIHKTEDIVEKEGINKSIEQIKEADLVIHVLDSTKEEDEEDKKVQSLSHDKVYLKVFNKKDLVKECKKGIFISAKNNEINDLIFAIESKFKKIDLNNEKIIYNTRQLSLIDSAKISIKEALNNLFSKKSNPDEVIVDIRKAWMDLGSIIGRADQEDLLDNMFKNFCLGK